MRLAQPMIRLRSNLQVSWHLYTLLRTYIKGCYAKQCQQCWNTSNVAWSCSPWVICVQVSSLWLSAWPWYPCALDLILRERSDSCRSVLDPSSFSTPQTWEACQLVSPLTVFIFHLPPLSPFLSHSVPSSPFAHHAFIFLVHKLSSFHVFIFMILFLWPPLEFSILRRWAFGKQI